MKSRGGTGWCCVSKAATHRLLLVGPVGGSEPSQREKTTGLVVLGATGRLPGVGEENKTTGRNEKSLFSAGPVSIEGHSAKILERPRGGGERLGLHFRRREGSGASERASERGRRRAGAVSGPGPQERELAAVGRCRPSNGLPGAASGLNSRLPRGLCAGWRRGRRERGGPGLRGVVAGGLGRAEALTEARAS